ncbi:hypothetical protein FOZ61_002166 [Perkinsus olseni]|uniref:Dynein heavy chain 1, axonemal n=1 Tax=Perkinsus olseni TaxID=32597 RepID=A0A7J6LU62_PEROL|nr:hypothetical protein FOZ61_002166 [Perkinsus olseni]
MSTPPSTPVAAPSSPAVPVQEVARRRSGSRRPSSSGWRSHINTEHILNDTYRVLGRDSDPNENGSEGPNTILRIFKASCIFMARELSAGHSVALTPSQTLVLGSDGASSRPKPILWISEEALRNSRLKLGSGVRAEPPKGPHKGINKHAVDGIAALGEIDLVTKFITTFFGKASEYICTAVQKGHSVNIDFNPVGRLAIDTTTGLVSFQGIEHDFANVTVQEAADPLGDRLAESPSRQRGIDIRSLHKEKLTIRHLVEEKARRLAQKLEDQQQPSRGLNASMSVPGLSLESGGEKKLGALVVGRGQLPRAMRSLLLTTPATVGGRERKAPPGVAEMPPLLDVFSRTPAASFKDSLVRPSLVAEIGSYHAPPWSRLLEMDTRPGKAGLTWARHKAEAWQAMEVELSMKERLQRRLWNTLVPPPLPEHLQESSRSLRPVGSGSRLEKTLCKWLIDGPMFRNILSRYNYYVETSSRSSGVPLDDLCPIEGEVLIRVQAKMAGQMQLWPDVDYKSRMRGMEQEVLNGYIAALRKAIVDYNLRYIFQRRRLDIPLTPSLLPPPFGANAFLVGDIMTFGGPPTEHWRRLVAHSRASLSDGKYAAPTFLCTQLTRQWSEGDYDEISLFGLGEQKELIDIERAQLIQLQYLEGKVKYLTEEWHTKALELVSQEPTLLAEASGEEPQPDGVPSPSSGAGSPKSSAAAAFAGTGAMDGAADWPTCNPDCLIEASTHLMSLMIRSVVERSCEKFIANFEGFCPQSTKPLGYPEVAQLPLGTADEPQALLLNTLVVDGNTVKLKYSPDYCHERLTRLYKDIVISMNGLKGPASVLPSEEPGHHRTALYEVTVGEGHISSLLKRLEGVVTLCLHAAGTVSDMYEPHLALLTEVERAREMASRIAEIPDLLTKGEEPSASTVEADAIIEYVRKLREAKRRVLDDCRSLLRTAMMATDCSEVNETLCKRCADCIDIVTAALNDRVRDRSQKFTASVAALEARFQEVPESEQALVDLEKELDDFYEKGQDVYEDEYSEIRRWLDVLFECDFAVPTDTLEAIHEASNRLGAISDLVPDRIEEVEFTRDDIEQALGERRDKVVAELETFKAVIQRFADYGDVHAADENCERLENLKAKMARYTSLQEEINSLEGLLKMDVTEFGVLEECQAELDVYDKLWSLVKDYGLKEHLWYKRGMFQLDAEAVESETMTMWRSAYKLQATFEQDGREAPMKAASFVKKGLDEVKKHLPLLQALCNPGLRGRHWAEISSVVGFTIARDKTTTLQKMLDMDMGNYVKDLADVSDRASQEYQIERSLESQQAEWQPATCDFKPWKETGTFILSGATVDEVQGLIDDHIIKTQTMKGSPSAQPFAEGIAEWEEFLMQATSVIEVWTKVQGVWLYLEPIFGSEDIMRQIPTEGALFKDVDVRWREIMEQSKESPAALEVFKQEGMLATLEKSQEQLERVQKGLNDYLESKRLKFPRFFFLSNDELLEILSETKDPVRVQPHLRKAFEGIQSLEFEEDKKITAMLSVEKERIGLTRVVDPMLARGNVEEWLVQLEMMMLETIRSVIFDSIADYPTKSYAEWLALWPGQVVIAVGNIFWTSEVMEALSSEGNAGLGKYHQQMDGLLQDIVSLVRGDIPPLVRCTLEALVVIFVHNKDTVQELHAKGLSSVDDFDWLVQLRYFVEKNADKEGDVDDVFVRISNSHLGKLKMHFEKNNLQWIDYLVDKIIQFYECHIVRHSVMLVGLPFSGKTTALNILQAALTDLAESGEMHKGQIVHQARLNPKSIPAGCLYGDFDDVSHEWTDGIVAVLFRNFAKNQTDERKWLVFDGPVDAVWIENMNTVMDENKKLCLNSGEIIAMSSNMRTIFEPMDVEVASPATISRNGMVYFEPHILGYEHLIKKSFKEDLPSTFGSEQIDEADGMQKWLLPPLLRTLKRECSEVSPSQEQNCVQSYLKLFSTLLKPLHDVQVYEEKGASTVAKIIDCLTVFSIIWSLGAACTTESRKIFDAKLRSLLKHEVEDSEHFKRVEPALPDRGSVYDYFFDVQQCKWLPWADTVTAEQQFPAGASPESIIVRTLDNIRYSFIANHCIDNRIPLLFCGPTGTGKTAYMQGAILSRDKATTVPIFLGFSAQTQCAQTQDQVDVKLDRRRKDTYGPPTGKLCVVMVDDLNMPAKEAYGAQPPIEILRQLVDQGGWFDRKDSTHPFRNIIDTLVVTAMGPPGGGRTFITPRMTQLMLLTGFALLDDDNMTRIFTTILDWRFQSQNYPADVKGLSEKLVSATLQVYKAVASELLPTPLKVHYTFNLRDFAKAMFGVLLLPKDQCDGANRHVRLWVHEVFRVFGDRLVDDKDRVWLLEQMRDVTRSHLGVGFDDVMKHLDSNSDGKVDTLDEVRLLFFGDLMSAPAAPKRPYTECPDFGSLANQVTSHLEQYNLMSTSPLNLVLFLYCIEHLSRVARVLKQPGGHSLMFPSLVNCTTIDWFSEWPSDALLSVAEQFLESVPMAEATRASCVEMCQLFHVESTKLATRFKLELRRHYYATPTSYLELINTFKTLLDEKRGEVSAKRDRYLVGLEKLANTEQSVAGMQKELTDLQPQLVAKNKEVEEMMGVVNAESDKTNAVKEVVSGEEAIASQAADRANAIKTDCEKELGEAMPELNEALGALDTLTGKDIAEIKAMTNPPEPVRLVLTAVCIMKGIGAVKVQDKETGKKVDDYWPNAKKMVSEMGFLQSLKDYDKDSIPPAVINKIKDYTVKDDFQPSRVAKVSKAAYGICCWVRAMETYDRVAKIVAPKREALAAAEAEYATVMVGLKKKQAELQEVLDKLQALNDKLSALETEQFNLKNQVEDCSRKLERAEQLITSLGGEKTRWTAMAEQLGVDYENLTGDVILASGVIAYLGAFTPEFRRDAVTAWSSISQSKEIPGSAQFALEKCLGEPVKIRSWTIAGLPNDAFSIENGIIVDKARRWPLCIDPQGQANKWIKNTEKDHNLVTCKFTDGDYLRRLEGCIQFGYPFLIENVLEDMDPAIEPLLLKQTFTKGGMTMMKLGDATIEYNKKFRLYLTSKLRNPHYLPEVSVKVTLLNFMITPVGLEDQLLNLVVSMEKPDLAAEKARVILEGAENKKQLEEIEDKILKVLSSSQGNILEDETAIQVLSASKVLSNEIAEKQSEAEQTEIRIDKARNCYVPVAEQASILFFCIADLAQIDPMYQYSLPFFVSLYEMCIRKAPEAHHLPDRIEILNSFFMQSLYNNICRSLFEKHKLLMSFQLCCSLKEARDELPVRDYRFLLTGGVSMEDPPPKAAQWIPDRCWGELFKMSRLGEPYTNVVEDFAKDQDLWKSAYDHSDPLARVMELGASLTAIEGFSEFQLLMVLRCLRPDKLVPAIMGFVANNLGGSFITPPPFDLASSYADSSNLTPLIFVLSPGSDPFAALSKFASDQNMEFKSISLGQGQGPRAEQMIDAGMREGSWVVLQNCHLCTSWMPKLERKLETMDPKNTHRNYRLWLTSYPSPQFPVAILQNGVKMTNEPPKGLRSNLMGSFLTDPICDTEFFEEKCVKPWHFKKLLYSLCFFHAVLQERRLFGPLGWNIPYEFTDSDMRISVLQLQMFINEYAASEVPFKALNYLTGECNYGGRVTDDKDRRLIMTLLADYFTAKAFDEEYSYTLECPQYRPPDGDGSYEDFLEAIRSLPAITDPRVFGFHPNANLTKEQNEAFDLMKAALLMGSQSGGAGGGSMSPEEVVGAISADILQRMPKPWRVEDVQESFPMTYTESMNTVLAQELTRYNGLINVIRESLADIQKAVKGLILMSPQLEAAFHSINDGRTPEMWMAKSYPSLKPLGSYVNDLIERYTIPIDTVDFDFEVVSGTPEKAPEDGVYIHGLFIEGCKWSEDAWTLAESDPKVLFVEAPRLWLKPMVGSEMNLDYPHYNCPLYKISSRRGVLATTGHSTNFVMYMRLPSEIPQAHWIKRGVAMLTQLDS